MTTMSDESARKIAESTVKKYENAGRKAMVALVDGKKVTSVQNMEPEEMAEIGLNLFLEIVGEDAEDILKDILKDLKAKRKQEAKDAKRKNRA